MSLFGYDAEKRARSLREQAEANAARGRSDVELASGAFGATATAPENPDLIGPPAPPIMPRQELDIPRVPRTPTPMQQAETQFAQTPMKRFMDYGKEGGTMPASDWAADDAEYGRSKGGELASGGGSGMAPGVLQKFIDARKAARPGVPDPNVVAAAKQKYAEEAQGWQDAAQGAYGGGGGGGGGGGAGGSYSLTPQRGMRPMNAREMIAYDAQRSEGALGLIKQGLARDEMMRKAKHDDAQLGLSREQMAQQGKMDERKFGLSERQLASTDAQKAAAQASTDAWRKSSEEARARQAEADLQWKRDQAAILAQIAGKKGEREDARDAEAARHNKEREKTANNPPAAPAPRTQMSPAEQAKLRGEINASRQRLVKAKQVAKDGGYYDDKNRWHADPTGKAAVEELDKQIREMEALLPPTEGAAGT